MLKAALRIIHYDLLLTRRQAYTWLTPLLFFVIVVCLFPLALGPDAPLLQTIAPGILWVAALLAIVMSIGHLFQSDMEAGHLDTLLQSPHPLTLLVLCKVLSHWLTYCLPLIMLSPLLGLLLHLDTATLLTLVMTLFLGTPVLCLLGAIGAGLVVGIRQQGLLLPVLIMPLYIPVLIFGTGAVMASLAHLPLSGYFAILGAFNLLALAFAPWLTGLALRMGGQH